MSGLPRMAIWLAIGVLLSACGGGGGGNGDPQAQEALLLELPITRNGRTSPGGDEYTVRVRFGPNNTELLLATVLTDDDGSLFEADPLDAAFPQLVEMLTNGESDSYSLRATLGVGSGGPITQDTNPNFLVSEDLDGPDLQGAGITRIGLRVDTVDIVTDQNNSTTHTLNAALVVFGFPN